MTTALLITCCCDFGCIRVSFLHLFEPDMGDMLSINAQFVAAFCGGKSHGLRCDVGVSSMMSIELTSAAGGGCLLRKQQLRDF